LFFRTICAVLALPLVAGQSCSSSSDGGRSEALFTACVNSVPAQCNYLATCLPIFMGTLFGDVDTCVARTRLICEAYATWPGVSWTAEKFDRCTEHIQQAACTGVEGLGGGPCTNLPGSLPSGSGCVDHSQCVTGFCNRPISPNGTSGCGTCQEMGCLGGGCKAGEACIASAQGTRCAEIQAEGTACTSASLCATGLSCLGGICTKSRGEGDACTNDEDCDRAKELTCVDDICRKPSLVDIGASCTSSMRCARAGICRNVSPSNSLTCVAPLPDGSPCGGAQGGICDPPALCISGVCTLPAQMTCP